MHANERGATVRPAWPSNRRLRVPVLRHGELRWDTAALTALEPLLAPSLELEFDGAARHYQDALARPQGGAHSAIALAVRLPFCAIHCLSCDRDIHAAQSGATIDDYVEHLVREIDLTARALGGEREVVQLDLGGGTVNELDESQIARIVQAVEAHWRVPADAELSAECDPRRVQPGHLRFLAGLGFRQIFFGVMDLDPSVQQAIGRSQSGALLEDVCELARRSGIETVDLGLMLGLPAQTPATWERTLARVIAMAPDRVTLARYRHRPQQASGQCAIAPEDLPDAEGSAAQAAVGAARLVSAGYRWLGDQHFVLDDDALALADDEGRLRRSLIAYTAMPEVPTIGLGAGAVGEVDHRIVCNESSLAAWRTALGEGRLPVAAIEHPNALETRRRAAVEHLLCALDLPAAMTVGGLEPGYQRLARHQADGWVRVERDRIVVTREGRSVLRALCEELAPAPTGSA